MDYIRDLLGVVPDPKRIIAIPAILQGLEQLFGNPVYFCVPHCSASRLGEQRAPCLSMVDTKLALAVQGYGGLRTGEFMLPFGVPGVERNDGVTLVVSTAAQYIHWEKQITGLETVES